MIFLSTVRHADMRSCSFILRLTITLICNLLLVIKVINYLVPLYSRPSGLSSEDHIKLWHMDYTLLVFNTKGFVSHKNKIIYVFKYVYIYIYIYIYIYVCVCVCVCVGGWVGGCVFPWTKDILFCLETIDTDHHKSFPFMV